MSREEGPRRGGLATLPSAPWPGRQVARWAPTGRGTRRTAFGMGFRCPAVISRTPSAWTRGRGIVVHRWIGDESPLPGGGSALPRRAAPAVASCSGKAAKPEA